MLKGLKLCAQPNGSKKEIEDALALSVTGIIPVTEVVPLASIDEALDSLTRGQAVGQKVISFS